MSDCCYVRFKAANEDALLRLSKIVSKLAPG